MSHRQVKATRRSLRRAIGTDALTVFQTNEQLLAILQNAVETTQRELTLQRGAHKEQEAFTLQRLIALSARMGEYERREMERAIIMRSGFLGRLGLAGRVVRWFVTGRSFR